MIDRRKEGQREREAEEEESKTFIYPSDPTSGGRPGQVYTVEEKRAFPRGEWRHAGGPSAPSSQSDRQDDEGGREREREGRERG